jgi:hypothetical protein
MDVLSIFNSVFLAFLTVEAIRLLFFTREWKYRFNKNSVPLKNWKKSIILMFLFVLIFPLINWFFIQYVSTLLVLLGLYQISLFVFLLAIIYLWIEKGILRFPFGMVDVLPILVIILDIALTFYFLRM